jgi:topoisomerase IA-like protein
MELIIGALIGLVFVAYMIYVNNTSKSEAGVKVEQADVTPVAVEAVPVVESTTSLPEVKKAAPARKTAAKKAPAKTAAKKTAAKKTAKPKAK